MTAAFDNLLKVPHCKPMELTIFDMFILIHRMSPLWLFLVILHILTLFPVLYSFINTHMATIGPFIRVGQIKQPTQIPSHGPQSTASIIPDDSVLVAIKNALSRWRDHWFALRNRVSSDEWASMGFYKNAYNFWLVSQLLITKKDAVDVIMQMEVHCEDKLEKLKVLLQDDQEEYNGND
jgi:hypothetical protein